MIENTEVYRRAVDLMEDPHISQAYYYNTVKFCKIMYSFLKNGVNRITAPTAVAALLSEQEAPMGQMEVIGEKEENKNEYSLEMHPSEGAFLDFYANGEIIQGASYNKTVNTVTFPDNIPTGAQLSVEWYAAGRFTGDFSKINGKFPLNSLIERTTDLLAQATVLSWAMSKRNSLLEGVLNNLTDTDFKVYSPAASLTAKKDWVENLRLELMNSCNKLDWDMRNQNRSYYGY